MPERDGSAIHAEPLLIGAADSARKARMLAREFVALNDAQAREHLRGEGHVGLEQRQVVERPSGGGERAPRA
jgi:hypothetical protein